MAGTFNILLAGFGGQGILFAGKLLAYAGMMEDKQVSWLPSYGPEMRGGTCNCSVIVSDEPVGSPLVLKPNLLVAMNLPSLDKFESTCAPGAKVFIDSTLIERKIERTDITPFYVPATRLADEAGVAKLANVVLVGKVLKETGVVGLDIMEPTMKKCIPPKHADLINANLRALKVGYEL